MTFRLPFDENETQDQRDVRAQDFVRDVDAQRSLGRTLSRVRQREHLHRGLSHSSSSFNLSDDRVYDTFVKVIQSGALPNMMVEALRQSAPPEAPANTEGSSSGSGSDPIVFGREQSI